MIKLLISIIFIFASIAIFFGYTKSAYDDLSTKQILLDKYNTAITKAQEVVDIKNEKLNKRNNIPPQFKAKLEKMVPVNTVDNIQLILDIDGIAKRNNVSLAKVDLGAADIKPNANTQNLAPINVGAKKKDIVKNAEIEFEFVASYDDFIKFLVDLEHSLRIVDVISLSFKSGGNTGSADSFSTFNSGIAEALDSTNQGATALNNQDVYRFQVRIRTYWVDIN